MNDEGGTAVTAAGPKGLAALNAFLEPLIRVGIGAPLPTPPLPDALWGLGWVPGLVVLEVPGRKSGRIYRVPLVGFARGPVVLLVTARGNSQWIRNLAAAPKVALWLRGRRRPGSAWVKGRSHFEPRADVTRRALGLLAPVLAAGSLHVAEIVLD